MIMSKQDFIYYGIFLDKDTRNMLIDELNNSQFSSAISKCDMIFLDHCTLLHCSQKNNENFETMKEFFEQNLGKTYEMTINSIGMNEKSIAFGISIPIICMNNKPHITIGTFEDGNPVDSNSIKNWVNVSNQKITGTLKKLINKK